MSVQSSGENQVKAQPVADPNSEASKIALSIQKRNAAAFTAVKASVATTCAMDVVVNQIFTPATKENAPSSMQTVAILPASSSAVAPQATKDIDLLTGKKSVSVLPTCLSALTVFIPAGAPKQDTPEISDNLSDDEVLLYSAAQKYLITPPTLGERFVKAYEGMVKGFEDDVMSPVTAYKNQDLAGAKKLGSVIGVSIASIIVAIVRLIATIIGGVAYLPISLYQNIEKEKVEKIAARTIKKAQLDKQKEAAKAKAVKAANAKIVNAVSEKDTKEALQARMNLIVADAKATGNFYKNFPALYSAAESELHAELQTKRGVDRCASLKKSFTENYYQTMVEEYLKDSNRPTVAAFLEGRTTRVKQMLLTMIDSRAVQVLKDANNLVDVAEIEAAAARIASLNQQIKVFCDSVNASGKKEMSLQDSERQTALYEAAKAEKEKIEKTRQPALAGLRAYNALKAEIVQVRTDLANAAKKAESDCAIAATLKGIADEVPIVPLAPDLYFAPVSEARQVYLASEIVRPNGVIVYRNGRKMIPIDGQSASVVNEKPALNADESMQALAARDRVKAKANHDESLVRIPGVVNLAGVDASLPAQRLVSAKAAPVSSKQAQKAAREEPLLIVESRDPNAPTSVQLAEREFQANKRPAVAIPNDGADLYEGRSSIVQPMKNELNEEEVAQMEQAILETVNKISFAEGTRGMPTDNAVAWGVSQSAMIRERPQQERLYNLTDADLDI